MAGRFFSKCDLVEFRDHSLIFLYVLRRPIIECLFYLLMETLFITPSISRLVDSLSVNKAGPTDSCRDIV